MYMEDFNFTREMVYEDLREPIDNLYEKFLKKMSMKETQNQEENDLKKKLKLVEERKYAFGLINRIEWIYRYQKEAFDLEKYKTQIAETSKLIYDISACITVN